MILWKSNDSDRGKENGVRIGDPMGNLGRLASRAAWHRDLGQGRRSCDGGWDDDDRRGVLPRRLPIDLPRRLVMTIDSPMDGTDAPLLFAGQPSGETMAIKRVDAYHTVAVLKWNGRLFGRSTFTLSRTGRRSPSKMKSRPRPAAA